MIAQKKQTPRISVAEYITQQIVMCGKQQKDIAAELGYEKPNMITMFKQGKTKIPLNKITKFAEILGVNPVHFLRIAMREYSPDTWEAIEKLLGGNLVSENELQIVDLIRYEANGVDVLPVSDVERDELRNLVAKWRERDQGLINAALQRVG